MAAMKVEFFGFSNKGRCEFTGKEGVPSFQVSFGDGTIAGHLSYRALLSLLKMKLAQESKTVPANPVPVLARVTPPLPAAPVPNGVK